MFKAVGYFKVLPNEKAVGCSICDARESLLHIQLFRHVIRVKGQGVLPPFGRG
jgi:hypothetical protein